MLRKVCSNRAATKACNAEKASESARLQVSTMLPGAPMYAELLQLSLASRASGSKEEVFVKTVVDLGLLLKIPVKSIRLATAEVNHYCVTIQDVAKHILEFCPAKLLGGHTGDSLKAFEDDLTTFWNTYSKVNPSHPVFKDFPNRCRCIPCKLHSDEGTGLRKSAVQQYSWGPVLHDSPNSLDRYYFFSCINAEQYKKFHTGTYATGNMMLDDICEHFAKQATQAYTEGILSEALGRFHLVWIGLEGDLPAHARCYRLKRHFSCAPNRMCPWCEADDLQVPFTDFRDSAVWRGTVNGSLPWESQGPFCQIPGGNSAKFLALDLFHLCHLGAVRSFAVNFLCYLTTVSCFVSWLCHWNTVTNRFLVVDHTIPAVEQLQNRLFSLVQEVNRSLKY